MDNERLINKFFDNIDGFNKTACLCIKHGDIEKAIDIYNRKIEYIKYSYEFDVISLTRACRMIEDIERLIDILS